MLLLRGGWVLGDPAKARKVLGWSHTVTFEELVKEMVESDFTVMSRERDLPGRHD